MAQPSYYDTNRQRSYPFIVDAATAFIPDDVIVDCGFTVYSDSGPVPLTESVWLASVTRNGATITLQFRCAAPGLATTPLTFTRQLADGHNAHEYVSAASGAGPCDIARWDGFVVTGQLESLFASMGSSSTITGTMYVEPATVRDCQHTFIRALNVANADRTRATNPAGCKQPCHATPPQPIWVNRTGMHGAIEFIPGYNMNIQLDAYTNTLTFAAVRGGGNGSAGEPCTPVPVYPGESNPTGANTFDGAVQCHEVFRTINGLSGPTVRVGSGSGARITYDEPNHTVVVDVDMNGLAVGNGASTAHTYTPPASGGPCDCGELP